MFETCIVCREVPPTPGEAFCEVCVKTMDTHPDESAVEFGVPDVGPTEKTLADGSPTQSGAAPISVEVEETEDPSGDQILRVTPKNLPEKILRHSA